MTEYSSTFVSYRFLIFSVRKKAGLLYTALGKNPLRETAFENQNQSLWDLHQEKSGHDIPISRI